MRAIVIQTSGRWCEVLLEDGVSRTCSLRGRFRLEGMRTTNPLAVGDEVLVENSSESNDEERGVVTRIFPRRNYIIRKASNLSKAYQVIASNMDQCMVIMSLLAPETPLAFLDRFLVTAEAYSVPAVIVLNKVDLLDEAMREVADALRYLYESIGYPVLFTSVEKQEGLDAFAEALKNKTTLVAGNSGVGKSSLINVIEPSLQLKTTPVSELYKSGKHTTTFARMYHLHSDIRIIDTPGIRGFGVVDMDKAELYHFFPEIFAASKDCKYHNCLHEQEPGCAVADAVERRDIALSRYRSYLQLLHDENDKHRL